MKPEKQGKSLFREKSVRRVSKPEQLNDYIRVTAPYVWIILIALVVMLAGILAWCIFGRVEVHNSDGTTREIAPITYVTN